MATLITGVPGTGKSALMVSEILRLLEENPSRTVYQHGIPELKIPHVQTFCNSPACLACKDVPQDQKKIMATNWFEYGKPDDIVILDEAQRIWPTRPAGSRKPLSVEYMEVWRKFGLHMYFGSQNPKLLDSDLRRQFILHQHLTSGWSGRKMYEWDTCSDTLDLKQGRERSYQPPKHTFGLYKSAEMHIKKPRKKPMSFYVAAVAIPLAIVVVGGLLYSKNTTKPAQEQPFQPVTMGDTGGQMIGQTIGYPDFKPTIEGKPESAPAYQHLLQVTSAPILAGCVKSEHSCKCYTQQATPYPMTYDQCQEHIMNLHFNPYAKSKGLPDHQALPVKTPAHNAQQKDGRLSG